MQNGSEYNTAKKREKKKKKSSQQQTGAGRHKTTIPQGAVTQNHPAQITAPIAQPRTGPSPTVQSSAPGPKQRHWPWWTECCWSQTRPRPPTTARTTTTTTEWAKKTRSTTTWTRLPRWHSWYHTGCPSCTDPGHRRRRGDCQCTDRSWPGRRSKGWSACRIPRPRHRPHICRRSPVFPDQSVICLCPLSTGRCVWSGSYRLAGVFIGGSTADLGTGAPFGSAPGR